MKLRELANFPFLDIDLDSLNIDLGETKNYLEELGTLEGLETVNAERLKLESAILFKMGYRSKVLRDEKLLEIYRETYIIIKDRLTKAQSVRGIKVQRNKVALAVYVEQVKESLIETKVAANKT